MNNIWYRFLSWFRKTVLGYEIFYGVDYAIKDKDYTCHLYGKRLRDGTVIIDDVQYSNPTKE